MYGHSLSTLCAHSFQNFYFYFYSPYTLLQICYYNAQLGLRRLLKIKNQELRQMKVLAGTILDQRSETEQFFMEALNEVRKLLTTSSIGLLHLLCCIVLRHYVLVCATYCFKHIDTYLLRSGSVEDKILCFNMKDCILCMHACKHVVVLQSTK